MTASFPPDSWFDSETSHGDLIAPQVFYEDFRITSPGPEIQIWSPVSSGELKFAAVGLSLPWLLAGVALTISGLIGLQKGWPDAGKLLAGGSFFTALGLGLLLLFRLLKHVRGKFRFDHRTQTLIHTRWRRVTEVPFSGLEAVELVQVGRMKRFGGRLPTYQLNLVFTGKRRRKPATMERKPETRRRKNLSYNGQLEFLRETGSQLANFLNIPFSAASHLLK